MQMIQLTEFTKSLPIANKVDLIWKIIDKG